MKHIVRATKLLSLALIAALFAADTSIMMLAIDAIPKPSLSPDPILCTAIGVIVGCLAYEGNL